MVEIQEAGCNLTVTLGEVSSLMAADGGAASREWEGGAGGYSILFLKLCTGIHMSEVERVSRRETGTKWLRKGP
jgi:hypothetical protein